MICFLIYCYFFNMVLYYIDFIIYKDVYLVYYNIIINEISFSKNKMEWY